MAPLDVTTAEAQVATSQSDLVVSQTTLEQGQVSLKNALSRNGLADPLLKDVEIVPLDRIDVPEKDDIPPMKDLISTAMTNRADIEVDRLNVINAKTSALGTQNGILPQAGVIVGATNNGTSGTSQIVPLRGASGLIPPGGGALPAGIFPCPAGVGSPGQLCSSPPQSLVGRRDQRARTNDPPQLPVGTSGRLFPADFAQPGGTSRLRNRAVWASPNRLEEPANRESGCGRCLEPVDRACSRRAPAIRQPSGAVSCRNNCCRPNRRNSPWELPRRFWSSSSSAIWQPLNRPK